MPNQPPAQAAPAASSLLSLDDQTLCRILKLLSSPVQSTELRGYMPENPWEHFPSLPALTRGRTYNKASNRDGKALAATCRRLGKLHDDLFVSCVDLSNGRMMNAAGEPAGACSCITCLRRALRACRSVDTAVLGSLNPKHTERPHEVGAGEELRRLRVLCVSVLPTAKYAHALATAVPLLKELQIMPRNGHCNLELHAGVPTFLANLPSSLRKLSFCAMPQCIQVLMGWLPDRSQLYAQRYMSREQEELWSSIGRMKSLEELFLNVFALIRLAPLAVSFCTKLRRIEISCDSWDFWIPSVAAFVSRCPPSLRELSIAFRKAQSVDLEDSLGRLTKLENLSLHCHNTRRIHVNFGSTRSTGLLPIAGSLRILRLVGVQRECFEVVARAFHLIVKLEEIVLDAQPDHEDFQSRDVPIQIPILQGIFGFLPSLRRAELSSMIGLVGSELVEVIRGAICTQSLRSLHLSCLGVCEPHPRDGSTIIAPGDTTGDDVAVAIGETFTQLVELSLDYGALSRVGLTAVGKNCTRLTKLSLSGSKGLDDGMLVVIGDWMKNLKKLDLGWRHESGVTSGGRAELVRCLPELQFSD